MNLFSEILECRLFAARHGSKLTLKLRLRTKAKAKAKPKPKPKPKAANVIEDENISNIDLARALIESKDIKKAREILIKVAESGNESEVHEAKLLYLQLK